MGLIARTPGGSTQFFAGPIAPDTAQVLFSSSQNDLAPENIANCSLLELLPQGAALAITGIAGGTPNRLLLVANRTAFDLTLSNLTGSATANQFSLNGDVTLAAGSSIQLLYDGLIQKWTAVAGTAPSGGGGQTINGLTLTGYEAITGAAVLADTLATGTTDDYDPAGLTDARILELTADAADSALSGIVPPRAGDVLTIANVAAAGMLTLLNENLSSDADNRFHLIDDVALPPGASLTIYYSANLTRWIALS